MYIYWFIYIFKKYISSIQEERQKARDMKNGLSDIRYEKCAVLNARYYVDKLYNMRSWNIINWTANKAKEIGFLV